MGLETCKNPTLLSSWDCIIVQMIHAIYINCIQILEHTQKYCPIFLSWEKDISSDSDSQTFMCMKITWRPKHRFLGPTSKIADSVGSGWGPQTTFLTSFWVTQAVVLGTDFEGHQSQNEREAYDLSNHYMQTSGDLKCSGAFHKIFKFCVSIW